MGKPPIGLNVFLANMWNLPEDLLGELRKVSLTPSLNIIVNEKYGSHAADFRQNLTNDIPKDFEYSISHTQGLGGFAILHPARKIGFDLEPMNRVTAKVATRIAFAPDEASQAPSPGHLWVAKEAAFKALRGPKQPQVLSALKVSGWQRPSKNSKSTFETFHLETPNISPDNDSIGVTFVWKGFIFGLFMVSTKFHP